MVPRALRHRIAAREYHPELRWPSRHLPAVADASAGAGLAAALALMARDRGEIDLALDRCGSGVGALDHGFDAIAPHTGVATRFFDSQCVILRDYLVLRRPQS